MTSDESVLWDGYEDRECGDHRTTGGRAWCYSCTEWCSDRVPCKGCELPLLRGLLADIVKAANGILHTHRRWAEFGKTEDAERLDEWTDLLQRAAVLSGGSGMEGT